VRSKERLGDWLIRLDVMPRNYTDLINC